MSNLHVNDYLAGRASGLASLGADIMSGFSILAACGFVNNGIRLAMIAFDSTSMKADFILSLRPVYRILLLLGGREKHASAYIVVLPWSKLLTAGLQQRHWIDKQLCDQNWDIWRLPSLQATLLRVLQPQCSQGRRWLTCWHTHQTCLLSGRRGWGKLMHSRVLHQLCPAQICILLDGLLLQPIWSVYSRIMPKRLFL